MVRGCLIPEITSSLSEEKSKPRLCKFRVFWAQDTGMSVVSWMILHKAHQSPKLPGGCCKQSQLDGAPQETSAGDGRGNRACLDPPLPALLHLLSSIRQEGWQGGQLLCPLPRGNLRQEAPQALSTTGAGMPSLHTRGRLCKMSSLGVWFISAHRFSDI